MKIFDAHLEYLFKMKAEIESEIESEIERQAVEVANFIATNNGEEFDPEVAKRIKDQWAGMFPAA